MCSATTAVPIFQRLPFPWPSNIRREPLRRINRKGGEKGLSSCKKSLAEKKFVVSSFLKIREVLEKGIEIGQGAMIVIGEM